MANNLQRLTLSFAGLLLFSQSAGALDNYKEFHRDHLDFEVGTQYFYSQANYSSSGTGTQSLLNGNHYQLLDSNLTVRYVPKRDWSVFGWGTVSNSESKNSVATRTNSSLSQAGVGADFVMYSESFQLIPEIIAVMPLEQVDPTSDTVLNNEGVMEVRSRLIAQKDFGGLRGYAWLGFNYRGDGRSFLLPWGVGTQLKLRRLRVGAELFGYQSMSEDTNKNSILRTAYINTVNAGSMRFYSVDPSLIDSQLYATWLVSPKLSLQVQGGTTLAGSNMAEGFHVGGLISYSFDLTQGYSEESYAEPTHSEVPGYRSNMYEESTLSSERKVKQFQEVVDDGVDQNLFKAPPKPKKPQINEEELQRQLDQTEFDVELKAKKKKKKR